MKATAFEWRHTVLIHQLVVGAAFATYLIQRDDVVWQLVKDTGENRVLFERVVFAIATLLVGAGAIICTRFGQHRHTAGVQGMMRSPDRQRAQYGGELLYILGLGSLAPTLGFVIMVGGEGLRLLRLMGGQPDLPRAEDSAVVPAGSSQASPHPIRALFAKWGMFLTMVIFTVTLNDRLAEALAFTVFFIAIILSFPIYHHKTNEPERSAG